MVHEFDLVERTANFGSEAIKFAKTFPRNVITVSVISQFVRASTSIGANYCEANNSESKKDFVHKVGISRKEAKETIFWLRMLLTAEPGLKDRIEFLQKEANELNLILSAIVKKASV